MPVNTSTPETDAGIDNSKPLSRQRTITKGPLDGEAKIAPPSTIGSESGERERPLMAQDTKLDGDRNSLRIEVSERESNSNEDNESDDSRADDSRRLNRIDSDLPSVQWSTLEVNGYKVLYPEDRFNGPRPPIHRQGKQDQEGRWWSIEVLPKEETREDCLIRINAACERLAGKLGKGKCVILCASVKIVDRENLLPPWMTPEFLYRINYGPITKKDFEKVRNFLVDQYCAVEGRRRGKTLSHIRRRHWKSLLPYPWGRAPIRNVVGHASKSFPRLEQHHLRKSVTSFQPPILIGFLDPKLSDDLHAAVYQGVTYNEDPNYDDFIYEMNERGVWSRVFLELELSLVRTLPQPYLAPSSFPLLPFAALVSDIRTFVQRVQQARSTAPGQSLTLGFQYVLNSSDYYIWDGETTWGKAERTWGVSKLEMQRHFVSILLRSKMDCGPELYPFPAGNNDYLTINETLLNIDFYKHCLNGCSLPKLSKRLDKLTLDFSSINAAFICSGPFKLMLTTSLEDHFTLDQDGYLQVFWDFEREPGARLQALECHFFWDHDYNNTR